VTALIEQVTRDVDYLNGCVLPLVPDDAGYGCFPGSIMAKCGVRDQGDYLC